MLKLESCCCCIPLRIGCIVVGYIYLAGAVIQAILSMINLRSGVQYLNIGSEGGEYLGTILITTSAITLAFTLLFLVFNVFLLVGLHKNRRSYVKAFWIYNLVFLIIWTVLFLASLVVGTFNGWYAVASILILGICIYFFLVILSHYNEMNSSNNIGQCARPNRR